MKEDAPVGVDLGDLTVTDKTGYVQVCFIPLSQRSSLPRRMLLDSVASPARRLEGSFDCERSVVCLRRDGV